MSFASLAGLLAAAPASAFLPPSRSRLATAVRRAGPRREASVAMIFGLGKRPAQGGVAGLVGEPIELEGIDKNKTVGWMNRWAAYAVTDNSLMGDEFGECLPRRTRNPGARNRRAPLIPARLPPACRPLATAVFPWEAAPLDDGISITLKTVNMEGEIVPLGLLDMRVVMSPPEATEGAGAIQVTRRDVERKAAYLGEAVVIGDMVNKLARAAENGSIDPDSAPAAIALAARVAGGADPDESGGASSASAGAATGIYPTKSAGETGDFTQWGAPPPKDEGGAGGGGSKAGAEIKATDTRFEAPWSVFFKDMKKKTEDRLNN